MNTISSVRDVDVVVPIDHRHHLILPSRIPNWSHEYYTSACYLQSITDYSDTLEYYLAGGSELTPVALNPNVSPPAPHLEYYITDKFCVDCTQIGTNHKPSFWP